MRAIVREVHSAARELGIHQALLVLSLGAESSAWSPDEEIVLALAADADRSYEIWHQLVHAQGIVAGRFPKVHPAAGPGWIDDLWHLSIEGRLVERGVLRKVPLPAGCPERFDDQATVVRSVRTTEIVRRIVEAGTHRSEIHVRELASFLRGCRAHAGDVLLQPPAWPAALRTDCQPCDLIAEVWGRFCCNQGSLIIVTACRCF